MGQILGLIAGKLDTLANARDEDALLRKRKAITALFPYAVWQERDKGYLIFDAFLRVAKTTKMFLFWWSPVEPFMKKLLDGTSHVFSNRALLLLSPCMPWGGFNFGEDRARIWAATVSTVPKEEEIAPSVVETLFQIAYHELLPPDLHSDAWSWLTLVPSLPPVCEGREKGIHLRVVQMVRDLKHIEILKSYLLLIWQVWDELSEDIYARMQTSIREDFSGIGMESHRADLLQRLDHVLTQFGRGLKHLQQDKPELDVADLLWRQIRYEQLRETLLEVDREALEVLTRASPGLTALFGLLTHVDTHRIAFNIHVCAPCGVPIADHTRHSQVRSLLRVHSRSSGMLNPYLPPPLTSLVAVVHWYWVYLRPSHYFQAVAVSSNYPLCGPPRLTTSDTIYLSAERRFSS